VGSQTLKKAKFLCMLLQLNWVQVIGTTLLSYIWLTNAISVTPASAADQVVSKTQNSELTTNQTNLENNLPDLQEVVAKKAELGQKAESILEQKQPQVTAQTETPGTTDNSSSDADKLRQDLLIEPLIKAATVKRIYSPGLNFGTPSAFGASWGDLFIGASGATAGKARDDVDGSISAGFGLGDPQKLIGLEFSYNIGSIKNFGENGTFDLKAHRIVYAKGNNQVAVAAGWNTFAQYGNEGIRPSGAYGVVTTYSLLKPNDPVNKMPVSFSLGAGGGDFRQGTDSTGVFGGAGLQVHPQVGLGLGWSGVGLNAGVSFVPVPTIPLIINAQGADLTDNSPGGTVFILSVGYGFNFLPK
jgi:hypothetical protein